MSTFGDWKRIIRTLGYPESPRAERRSPSGIAALYGSRYAPKLGRIRNISFTGIYLETEDRWPVGDVVPLTLVREQPAEKPSELQIDVKVRIVVQGKDGVGAAFLLPEGLDLQLWEALVDHLDAQPETDQLSFFFRLVRTILFLCRLCPTQARAIIQSLGKGLDTSRTESAMRIALGAEKLLARDSDGDTRCAHPQIVASILKEGSWAKDEVLCQLWTGLFASSCTADGADESNRRFIELLVHVTANQALIFVAGCRGARAKPTDLILRQTVITPEEMIRITGLSDLYRSATDVAYLYSAGLLRKIFDFSTYLPKDLIDITPSRLGIELFDRCQGHLLLGGSDSL